MMESAGVRALLAPSALPRITSRESAPETTDEAPAARMTRRPLEAQDRRVPIFNREVASPSRPEPPPSSGASLRSLVVGPEKATQRPAAPIAATDRAVEAGRTKGCVTRIRIPSTLDGFGEIVLELGLRGSVLHGTVIAESDAARERLQSQLGLLKDSLERRGIRVGELKVTVGDPDDEPRAPVLRSVRPRLLDLLA